MNGIIVINKEKDYTSRDVVNILTKVFKTKKVGHTGTLDPLATGVLVITIGKYTKLGEELTSSYKEYVATMKLGVKTDTLDITGTILEKQEVKISKENIMTVVSSYQKKYWQEVPLYSAVKVKGKKLYEYARNKEKVELPKKEVDIKEIEILSIKDDIVKFRCIVSKGTYIRSLIRDIGDTLGCKATMLALTRTKQGIFTLNDAYTLDDIKNGNYKLLELEDILDLEIIDNYDDLKPILNGVKIKYESACTFLLFKENNKNVALYKKDDVYYRMFLLLKKD